MLGFLGFMQLAVEHEAGAPRYRRQGELTTLANSKRKLLPWAVFKSYLAGTSDCFTHEQ